VPDTKTTKKVFKYHRFCKLERCKKPFKTNYKQKLFCEYEHQQEWHQINRREAGRVLTRLSAIEKENKEIKEKLKTIE